MKKKLKKMYDEFLFESGISKIIKEYVDIIIEIYNTGKRKFSITLSDDKLPLYNTEFIFYDNYSYFQPLSGINDNKIIAKFYISIQNNIKEELTHELTHAIEYFNIIKKLKEPLNYSLKQALDQTKYQSLTAFDSFRYLIYLTLDKELNSRVSQVYKTLRECRTKDYNILYNVLINTYSWKRLENIKSFDPVLITSHLINKLNEIAVIHLINDFNNNFINILGIKQKPIPKKYDFMNKKLLNKGDIIQYFNKWKKIFEIKTKKHEEKLLQMIIVVISDIIDLEKYNTKGESPKFFNEYLKFIEDQKIIKI